LENEKWQKCKFYVVNVPGPAIIGLPSCREFNIVTINVDSIKSLPVINTMEDLKSLYPDQFDKIGKLKALQNYTSKKMLNHLLMHHANAQYILEMH
jgi:hypothetical protein